VCCLGSPEDLLKCNRELHLYYYQRLIENDGFIFKLLKQQNLLTCFVRHCFFYVYTNILLSHPGLISVLKKDLLIYKQRGLGLIWNEYNSRGRDRNMLAIVIKRRSKPNVNIPF
jgi:hypothetical protein